MQRRMILSMIAGVAAMMLAMLGGSTTASAQCPDDCTYWVDMQCNISPACFPLKLTSGWHCLNSINAITIFLNPNDCGGKKYQRPGPCKPVPCEMLWVSLDGGMTAVFPNGPPARYTCNDGSTICLSFTEAPVGCYFIKIFPC